MQLEALGSDPKWAVPEAPKPHRNKNVEVSHTGDGSTTQAKTSYL